MTIPVRFLREKGGYPYAIEITPDPEFAFAIDIEVAKNTARFIGIHLSGRRPQVRTTDRVLGNVMVTIVLDYRRSQHELPNDELVRLVRRSLRSARRLLSPMRTPSRRETIGNGVQSKAAE